MVRERVGKWRRRGRDLDDYEKLKDGKIAFFFLKLSSIAGTNDALFGGVGNVVFF